MGHSEEAFGDMMFSSEEVEPEQREWLGREKVGVMGSGEAMSDEEELEVWV